MGSVSDPWPAREPAQQDGGYIRERSRSIRTGTRYDWCILQRSRQSMSTAPRAREEPERRPADRANDRPGRSTGYKKCSCAQTIGSTNLVVALTGTCCRGSCGARSPAGNVRKLHRHHQERRAALYLLAARAPPDDKHTVAISGHGTDAYITKVVLDHLASDSFETPEVTFTGDGRLAQIREAITELMAAHRTGQLSGAIVFPQVQQLEEEQYALEAERAAFIRETSGPQTAAISPKSWEELSIDKQRAVVETIIGAILVKPATQRSTKIDYDRLKVIPRK